MNIFKNGIIRNVWLTSFKTQNATAEAAKSELLTKLGSDAVTYEIGIVFYKTFFKKNMFENVNIASELRYNWIEH